MLLIENISNDNIASKPFGYNVDAGNIFPGDEDGQQQMMRLDEINSLIYFVIR